MEEAQEDPNPSFGMEEAEEKPSFDGEEDTDLGNDYRCLICWSDVFKEEPDMNEESVPLFPGAGRKHLTNRQLWTNFVLQDLLKLPGGKLTEVVQENEEENCLTGWFDGFLLCKSCQETVKGAMGVYTELLRLAEEFGRIQIEVNTEIRASLSGKKNNNQGPDNPAMARSIKIRKFFGEEEQHPENSLELQEDLALQVLRHVGSTSAHLFCGDPLCTNPLCTPSTQEAEGDEVPSDSDEEWPLVNEDLNESNDSDESEAPPPKKRKSTTDEAESYQAPFNCTICLSQRLFPTSRALALHLHRHRTYKYSCSKCKFPCVSESSLNHHLQKKLCNPSYDFKCDLCDFFTQKEAHLRQHRNAKHSTEKSVDPEIPEVSLDADIEAKEEVEEMEQCEDSGEEWTPLTPGVGDEDLSDCSRNQSNSRNVTPEHEMKQEGTSTCEICPRMFPNVASLAMHMNHHKKNKHPCPKCKYPCCSEASLADHLEKDLCTPKYEYKCKLCGFFTEREANLRQHRIRLHGAKSSPVTPKSIKSSKRVKTANKCDRCGLKIIDKQRYEYHVKMHEYTENCEVVDGKIKCKICGELAENDKKLRDHLRSSHTEDLQVSVYPCNSCNKIFYRQDSLDVHLAQVHRVREARHKCDLCGFGTSKRCLLKRHMLRHAKDGRNEEPKTTPGTTKKSVKKNTKEKSGEGDNKTTTAVKRRVIRETKKKVAPPEPELPLFSCDTCGAKFKDQEKLEYHRKMHEYYENCEEIDGKLKCKICGDLVPGPLFLRRHVRARHGSELGLPVFQCPECERNYSNKHDLNDHVKQVHTKEYKLHCEICGFGTHHQFSLKKHMICHTSERSFVCELCAATFVSYSILGTHMRRVHNSARRDDKLNCKFCGSGVTFLNKSLLNRHLKEAHQDKYVYKCEDCENAYLSGASLQLHRKTSHFGEEAECQFCGSKVGHRVYLYKHYQTCRKKPPGFKFTVPRT